MTRSFANGNGATVANGGTYANGPWALRGDTGWDIRPVTSWDMTGWRDYR